MRTMFIFIIVLLCSCRVHAISWLRAATVDETTSSTVQIETLPSFHSSQDIQNVINSAERLQAYSRQPDCFHRVARTIKTQCGELEMNENERIKAAVSMTLCELRTAMHAPPMECRPYAQSDDSSEFHLSRSVLNTCVEALSRSAQYWSSYSGYLREVPQLCFAFRRWNDIDTAKELYQNATVDKVVLLRLLLDRERKMHESQNHMSLALKGMHTLIESLDTVSSKFEVASKLAAENMQLRTNAMIEMLQMELLKLTENSGVRQEQGLSLMEETINNVATAHAASLTSLLPSLEVSIQERMDALLARSEAQVQESLEVLQHQWCNLGHEVNVVQEALQHLSAATHLAAVQFQTQVDDALHAHAVEQQVTADSAHQLAEVLTVLKVKTMDEINSINNTAAAIRDALLQRPPSSGYTTLVALFKNCLFWLLELVLRVQSGHLDYLLRLPMLRSCVGILVCIMRVGFSVLMSIAVLLFSPKRRSSDASRSAGENDSGRLSLAFRSAYTARSTSSALLRNSVSASRATLRMSRVPDRLLYSSGPLDSAF